MALGTIVTHLRDFFWNEPFTAVGLTAALIAFATTPMAFAILGRLEWFRARRGRVMQRPEFWSIACAMMLVMGIPAIFAAIVIKSRHFDRDRYEFDPNRTLTPLDQGRQYRTLHEANEAVRQDRERLEAEQARLVESVKKLDDLARSAEVATAMRATGAQSPGAAKSLLAFFDDLAAVRRAIGLDAPQQVEDLTRPLVALSEASAPSAASAASSAPPLAAAPAPAAPVGNGLGPAEVQAEQEAVPEPQKHLAAMLPLADIPAGWVVAKSGDRYIETFNADNLFEKINGRAESFIQYGVKGMAYTYYHPEGDESREAQLYVFEMGDPLKALGKFASEKPEEVEALDIGAESYTSAGSVFVRVGPYYTQVVTTSDDPKVAAFAIEIARAVAARQASPAASPGDTPEGGATPPEALFALLPEQPSKSGLKYVAQDAFGYSFLSDVFMADYAEGDVAWQGFLRPYASPEEAREVFDRYVKTAEQDGAELKTIDDPSADRMVVSSNIGLIDAIFLKGNAVGGANGATDAARAEAFAKSFAGALPPRVPTIQDKTPPTEGTAGPKEEP